MQVMAAPTIPVSTEEKLRDPIDISVDIIHPEPVAEVNFPVAAVVRTQAQHREAIRGILEHLQAVPIEEEMNTLRFRVGMAEAENASLRGKIKTMEAIEMLELPQENSNFKKCYADEPLAVPLDGLHIEDKLYFVKEPVEIMDHEVKRLRQSRVLIVMV
ncbi:hypothetical protein Tco_1219187 [Tanacetum coccineum]